MDTIRVKLLRTIDRSRDEIEVPLIIPARKRPVEQVLLGVPVQESGMDEQSRDPIVTVAMG
jgi:hypothetical protein